MAESRYNIELLTGTDAASPQVPTRTHRHRLTVFLLTLFGLLVTGLYYNFQRPAVYRSSATLLTVAPPDIDQQIAEADLQHVAIQRQRLLSKPLLDMVASRLEKEYSETGTPFPSVYKLQPMLSVEALAETNLVKVQAEGPHAALLPRLVNGLLDVYLDDRAEEARNVSAATTTALRNQYGDLGRKITQKREALDQFRRDNEILSIGRDENQVLARLNGLTASLNSASEEEVKAKARLDAIQAAVKRGEAVVPDEDKRTLAQMEKRAQELREKLAELDSRYTRSFFQLDPEMEVLPGQLEKLERKIREQRDNGRDIVTTSAQQEYAAARQSARELRRQLDKHKQKATEFTARFAEHEALQEDLTSLEELYRETGERLVQIEVENRQKYPQVKVVEWAFQPSEPISPHYLRDAGFVLAASVGLALFAVWLVDFLRPRVREASPPTLAGVAFYPPPGAPAIEQERTVTQIGADPSLVLDSPMSRELSPTEIELLFEGADLATRQLLVLLLAGLTAEEILALGDEDMDTATGEVKVNGSSKRVIQIPPSLVELFISEEGPRLLFRTGERATLDREELDARLQLAATDAGLRNSDQVGCQVLRHSYIGYLVRQGVRLSELGRIVGNISPKSLAAYSRISPVGPGRALQEISVFYPLTL